MSSALRAEFRKLLSVRSTYILTCLAFLMVSFVSFWELGYKSNPVSTSGFLAHNLYQMVAPITSLLTVIVAILLMAHEYRYNTIIYTLTTSNSRSKILIAKIITVTIYVAAVTAIATGLFLVLSALGHNVAGHSLPAQLLPLDIFAKILFYCTGFALIGLMFAVLIRNLIFALVFMLIAPNTIEGIATLIFKQKAVYLPFSSLRQVIAPPGQSAVDNVAFQQGHFSPLKAAMIFSIYLVLGWAVTWYLFSRRDAN